MFCSFQQFEFTWHKDIRPGKRTVCFDVSQSIKKAPVILFNCHGMGGNQRFKYNIVSTYPNIALRENPVNLPKNKTI